MPINKNRTISLLISVLLLGACSHIPKNTASVLPKILYSNASIEAIDWKKLLPPPPEAASGTDKIDMEMVLEAQKLRNTNRWDRAVSDADLDGFNAFSPILGESFKKENYPQEAKIFAIVLKYSFAMSKASKSLYFRKRPFEVNSEIKTCPNSLAGGSSYPSGHAAIGWANAQILARIFPQYADDLMARGIDYGQSRLICGVHYPTDIVAGRILGDVMLQKLYQDEEFTKLLQSAQEKAKLGGKSAKN